MTIPIAGRVAIAEAFTYCTVTAFRAGVVVNGVTYVHERPWSSQGAAAKLVNIVRRLGSVDLSHWRPVGVDLV